MYTNAFEALKAPPNYNTRDISRHIQLLLAEGAARDMTEPHRLSLLSPSDRLYNELLTLRGADYDAPADEKQRKFLAHVSQTLSGASLEPFPFAVAAGWLPGLRRVTGEEIRPNKSALKKAISSSKDTWLLQGAAALCTRAAILAETADSAHTVTAWKEAMGWWQKFFAIASVEDTIAYAMQTDDKSREACKAAWQGFRNRLAQELYGRCTAEYVAQNNGAAINACLNTLNSSAMRLLAPDLYEQAVKAVEPSIASGLMKSTNLREALRLWEGLPAFFKNKPSIIAKVFSAVSTETTNIDKGHGDYRIVEKAWKDLGGDGLKANDSIEIKAALQKYYDAVSLITRNTLSDGNEAAKTAKLPAVRALLEHLPPDYTVATDPSGQKLTTAMFQSMIVSKEIQEDIENIAKYKLSEAKQKGAALWERILAATPGEKAGSELRKGMTTTILLKLRERNDTAFMLAFLDRFPKDQPINSQDFTTLQEVIDNITIGDKVEKAAKLLQVFSEGDVTQSGMSATLSELFLAVSAVNHEVKDLDEVYENVLKQKLILCVNKYTSSENAAAKNLGLEIIGRLPTNATLPGEDAPLPIQTVKDMLEMSAYDRRQMAERMAAIQREYEHKKAESSVSVRKAVFFLLFEALAVLPYAIPYWLDAIAGVNLILFIITTIVAYIIIAVVTMTTRKRVIYAPYRKEVTEPVIMPLEYSHPLVMLIVMLMIPILFYVSTVVS